jgi:predicted RNase H-like nuclease
MTTLLIGFDSAWTAESSGALVGVLRAGKDGVAGNLLMTV